MSFSFLIKVLVCNLLLFVSIQMTSKAAGLTGKVYDQKTGEPVIGAVVKVDGANLGAVTDINGNYLIKGLKSNLVSISVSCLSYQPILLENVEINKERLEYIDITLNKDDNLLDEVEVVAVSERNTEKALLIKRRTSLSVFDGISLQQMEINGDYDASDALKRLPGITVKSSKNIHVRGMGERYNIVTLNEVQLPGLNPDNNSVQADLFPSVIIDNIKVYKTASPDLPGTFSGGYIDIVTKDIPRDKFFSASYMTGYNNQATFNPNYLTFKSGKTNWLGLDDGTREIPFYDQEELNKLQEELDFQKIADITEKYNSDIDFRRKSPYLNQLLNLSLGDATTLFGKEFGYIFSGSYKNSNYFYDNGKTGKYSLFTDINEADQLAVKYNFDETKSKETVFWNGLLGLSLKIDKLKKFSYNTMYSHVGETRAYLREGFSSVTQNNFDENTAVKGRQEFVSRNMFSNQLLYEMQYSKSFPLKIKTNLSYTKANMEMPDLRLLLYSYNDEDSKREYNLYTKNDQYISRVIRSLDEENYFGKLDLSYMSVVSDNIRLKYKAGGNYLQKNRLFRDNKVNYWDSHKMGGSQYGFEGSMEEYLNNVYEGGADSGVFIRNSYEARNNYDADEINYAFFGMGTLYFFNWKIMAGVRGEATSVYLTSFEEDLFLVNELLEDRIDILPSVMISKEFKNNSVIKLAASKTIDRPSLIERSPIAVFDNVRNFEYVGNPEITVSTVNNYDLRYEWFLPDEQLIAASAYYKDLKNPIELVDVSGAEEGRMTSKNVPKATVYGLEFEVRKNFSFISSSLKNLSLNINTAIIKSLVDIDKEELDDIRIFDPDAKKQRPFYYQAPWILNTSLVYNKKKYELALTYNIQGETISIVTSGATPDVILAPRNDLNFTAKYNLNAKWAFNIHGINILNESYHQSINFLGEEYIVRDYKKGSFYRLGISYRF